MKKLITIVMIISALMLGGCNKHGEKASADKKPAVTSAAAESAAEKKPAKEKKKSSKKKKSDDTSKADTDSQTVCAEDDVPIEQAVVLPDAEEPPQETDVFDPPPTDQNTDSVIELPVIPVD